MIIDATNFPIILFLEKSSFKSIRNIKNKIKLNKNINSGDKELMR